MVKKIIIFCCIIFLLVSALFASQSTHFILTELAMVAGGERSIGHDFELAIGILGEAIGDSAIVEAVAPSPPEGSGVTIDVTGTIDDDGATLELEVDSPQAEYQVLIADDTWKADDVELSEGQRQIIVTGTDILGNPQTEEMQVTVDTVSPSRPTLNPIVSPTSSSPQILSGNKQVNASIWLNGVEAVPVDFNTNWMCNIFLTEGENPFTIFSKDMAQNASTNIVDNIFLDTTAPTVTITLPADGSLATDSEIEVLGTVDEDVDKVEVNEIQAAINGDTFIAAGVVLQDGWNTVSATARDELGNTFIHSINVFLDTTLPYKPSINAVKTPTNTSPQTISGAKDAYASLWLNEVEIIPLNPDTEWSYDRPLQEGDNPISLYVMDGFGRTSEVENTQSIFLDTTLPHKPSVSDDGVYFVASNELHAAWSSTDPETDIAEYQYGIGTSPGERDVLEWTSAGLDSEITNINLGLIHKKTYFFTVKALNFAGSWSELGNSDGITLNKSIPEILSISPYTGTKFKEGETVRISISASDADGDNLEYKYLINGGVVQDWSEFNYFDWVTSVGEFGRKGMGVYARDGLEGESIDLTSVFIFLKPVSPLEQKEQHPLGCESAYRAINGVTPNSKRSSRF